MKKIKLTQEQYALVDNDDFDELNKHKWYAQYDKGTNDYYAVRNSKQVNGKQKQIRMHRVIMGANKGEFVDHRNHCNADNRKSNLRICTHSQNHMNELPRKGQTTSKYKGVSWHNQIKKWQSYVSINGKRKHIGIFDDEIEAAKAYDVEAKKSYGEFAYLNFDLWRLDI